jgi:hypothetical protein
MELFIKENWEFKVVGDYKGYRNKISGWWIYEEEYDESVLITDTVLDIVSKRGVSSAITDIKSWLENPPHNFDKKLYEKVLKTIERKNVV